MKRLTASLAAFAALLSFLALAAAQQPGNQESQLRLRVSGFITSLPGTEGPNANCLLRSSDPTPGSFCEYVFGAHDVQATRSLAEAFLRELGVETTEQAWSFPEFGEGWRVAWEVPAGIMSFSLSSGRLLFAQLTAHETRSANERADTRGAALAIPGTKPDFCGNMFPEDENIQCATSDSDGLSARHGMAAYLHDIGVMNPEWALGTSPESWAVGWHTPAGEMGVSFSSGYIFASFSPTDPCADRKAPDAFGFAEHARGSTMHAEYSVVLECGTFEVQDEYGQTPLIYAIERGNFETVMYLRNHNDVNHRTAAGWTPLMYAAKNSDEIIVEILLEVGADPYAVAPDGTSVLDLFPGSPVLLRAVGRQP